MTPQTRPRTIASVKLNGARLNGRVSSRIHTRPPRSGPVEPMLVTTCRRLPTGPLCVGLALIVAAYFIWELVR